MRGLVLCCIAVVLIQLATEGDAVCCHGKGPLWKSRCADCSKGTPYCPHGKSCNVFGCNCDGGCREGPCPYPHGQDYGHPHGNGDNYGRQYGNMEQTGKPMMYDVEENNPMKYDDVAENDKPMQFDDVAENDNPMKYDDVAENDNPMKYDDVAENDNPKLYDDIAEPEPSAKPWEETTPDDIIKTADENGDGFMDVDEAEKYLQKRGLSAAGYRTKRSILDLDLNNDYFITADEIEPYL